MKWMLSLLLFAGCVTKQPERPKPVPPRPPMVMAESAESVQGMAVVTPAIPLKMFWDCGCKQPMPHLGHNYTVKFSNDLVNWRTVVTNQPPVIDRNPLFFFVGCHIGNLK